MTPAHALPRPGPRDGDAGRLGMWVFLSTEVLFFGGLLLAYTHGRMHWPQGFRTASRHTDVVLGTLNTALLLSSSALVALAVACGAHPAQRRWSARLLAASAVLGCAFLAVKGVEYRREWHEGLLPGPGFALQGTTGAELFFVLYFVATSLHALHLAIGVALLALLAWGCRRRKHWARAGRVEIAGLYWHFVDIVWIVLYPLLYLVSRA